MSTTPEQGSQAQGLGELSGQSARDRLTESQRMDAERNLLVALIGGLSPSEAKQLALWWRQDAPGDPFVRAYIADLIERKEYPSVR